MPRLLVGQKLKTHQLAGSVEILCYSSNHVAAEIWLDFAREHSGCH